MTKVTICSKTYSSSEIVAKRTQITKALFQRSSNIKTPVITKLIPEDLRILYELYDAVFLEGWFHRNLLGRIQFSISSRLTKSAGKTICPRNISSLKPQAVTLEIRLGVDFFYNYDQIADARRVSGIITHSAVEALQIVFEHELCHVLEFLHFGQSNCRGIRFKTMAHNLFGHTESYHCLPTRQRIAQEKLGFKLGDEVAFRLGDQRLRGILYNIRKRATVMVHDKTGAYVDRKGNRYHKYYVPLKLLESTGLH